MPGFPLTASTPGAIQARPGSLRELFAGRGFDPPWIERHVLRTGNFTTRHDDLFQAVSGDNLGIGKSFFEALGGFDETFARHGGENTEFGYQGQTRRGSWCRRSTPSPSTKCAASIMSAR